VTSALFWDSAWVKKSCNISNRLPFCDV